MNWNLAKSRFGRLVTAGAFIGATFVASAAQVIVNSEFGTDAAPSLSGWTLLTGTANARPSTHKINKGLGAGDQSKVFDLDDASFFNNGAFAVLGDNRRYTGGKPKSGLSLLYQDFYLGGGSGSWDLDISFRSAFDGKGVGDIFGAVLCNPGIFGCGGGYYNPLFTQTFGGSQLNNAPFSTTLYGIASGTYRLMFGLNELTSKGSTAAGIDDVSIYAVNTYAVAAVPLPATAWLFGSALVGLAVILRRRAV